MSEDPEVSGQGGHRISSVSAVVIPLLFRAGDSPLPYREVATAPSGLEGPPRTGLPLPQYACTDKGVSPSARNRSRHG